MQLDPLSIFNSQAFETKLSSQPNNLLPIFKQAISEGNEALKQAFEQGADTIDMVHARAAFIDQILIHAFNFCFSDCK